MSRQSAMAFGQVLAASQGLTNALHSTQSAAGTIERNLPFASDEHLVIDRIREDAAALRAIADSLDAALEALTVASALPQNKAA